jgi:hypothetical protein
MFRNLSFSANPKHIKIRDAVISLPLIQKSRQVTAGLGKILLLDANQCHPRTGLEFLERNRRQHQGPRRLYA